MKYVETSRARTLRRVLVWLFVICGYLLSTTFAYGYVEVDSEPELIAMTALNLAFGSIGTDHPVYRNTVFGVMYMVIPLIGFFFMFFDKKGNVKNLVGICCGAIGCLSIALPIGFNEELAPGIGSILSMLLYVFITTISAISVFVKIEDNAKARNEGEVPLLNSKL